MKIYKATKIKLKLQIRKLNECWSEDGIHSFNHYPITEIFNIMTNHYTPDAPRIYISKIKGKMKSLKYTIIFETISDRREAYKYLQNIVFTDDLFEKAFNLIALK